MKITYRWFDEYDKPAHWNTRTTLYLGMPKLFHLYQKLNDKKLRVFLRKLKGAILDVGCGDGKFMHYAQVGVDFSKGMIKRARIRHPHRNFVCASVLHLPFKNKVFSNAFTVDVLLHIPPDKINFALKEIDRVSDDSYNFLGEDRTVIAFILEFLRDIPLKKIMMQIIPYVVVFFAFPLDRLRKLKIGSASEVNRKLIGKELRD